MDTNSLGEEFERHRPYLRAVAYQLLGSLADAEDAVQEAWLRLHRVDPHGIDHLKAWLTQVTARICLDELKSARVQRQSYVGEWLPEPWVDDQPATDPAEQVTLDESVGLAMLVVLETLTPPQRTAFVLHDVFKMPYEDVAEVVGRPAASVRQLASRARRRVQERRPAFDHDPGVHRAAIHAFLTAARGGDLAGLLRTLDPDVVWRSDGAGQLGAPRRSIKGSEQVATMVLRRAPTYVEHARVVTVNGVPGVAVWDGEQLYAVIGFTVHAGRITEVDAVYNPEKLRHVLLG